MPAGSVESFFSWILVLCGFVFDKPLYVVAAGLFAIATNIAQIRGTISGDKRDGRN